MLSKKAKRRFRNLVRLPSSQAALEFITTYGWAILAVLIAIATLAYFGVLSPDQFFPDKCIFPPGITCLDHRIEQFQAVLVLQNSIGDPIFIDYVKVSNNNQECSDNSSVNLNNNDKVIITVSQCNNGAIGEKFDGAINITYTQEGKLTHSVSGRLTTKIVEGSSISSQNICQDAETNGLCDGLDIVYGIGYRDSCCGELTLCCP